MFIWGNMFGGMISSEAPYILIMIIGMILVKTELMNYDGLSSIGKVCIEIFIPCYLFINICGSTSVDQIIENSVVIISQLVMIAMGFIISYIYCIIADIDVRNKWTLISLVCISEIKHVSQFQNNTFCFHLDDKNESESSYCSNIKTNHNSHMFFQAFIFWYFFLFAIRKGRETRRIILEVGRAVGRAVAHCDDNKFLEDNYILETNEYLVNEKQSAAKALNIGYIKNKLKTVDKTESTLYANELFYKEILDYHKIYIKRGEHKKSLIHKISYILFGPCQITLFSGFIAGFITDFKVWMFDKTKAQVMFFDTFNFMGLSHLIISYLMLGSAILINKKAEYNYSFRKVDHVFVFLLRGLIFPFFGVIYSYIVINISDTNRVVAFNTFLQWFTPSSIDLIIIAFAKEMNARDVGISIMGQWIIMMVFGTFTSLCAVLGALGLNN